MKEIEIFDPAMCCSSGVCGPSIDTELIRISALINTLTKKGMIIKRHNLSSDPEDFLSNKVVNEQLSKKGPDILPITLVDGVITKTRKYPTNDEFSRWLEISILSHDDKKSNIQENDDKTRGCCSDKNYCDIRCKPLKD